MKNIFITPILEANKNLSKRIQRLEKENQELFWFREKYENSLRRIEKLRNQIRKKNQVKVVGREYGDDIYYSLQIRDLRHTPEGIFVEVLLPKKLSNPMKKQTLKLKKKRKKS